MSVVVDKLLEKNKPTNLITQPKVEKILAHFGIRGMKWGVRRPRGPSGTVSSGIKPSKLSDQDLQQMVNRMRLEQEFIRLSSTPKQKSLISKGRTFALTLLKDVAATEVRRVTKTAAQIQVEKALQKHGTVTAKEIGQRLAPNKKKKK